MRVIFNSPRLSAVIGSSALMLAYFGILTVANSFSHAVEQLTGMWYLVIPLILGFGVQMWLYSYVRTACRVEGVASTSSVAAVGGVSTTSMIACCAHHATDVLPIIGLSGAAVFLTQYQAAFMA